MLKKRQQEIKKLRKKLWEQKDAAVPLVEEPPNVLSPPSSSSAMDDTMDEKIFSLSSSSPEDEKQHVNMGGTIHQKSPGKMEKLDDDDDEDPDIFELELEFTPVRKLHVQATQAKLAEQASRERIYARQKIQEMEEEEEQDDDADYDYWMDDPFSFCFSSPSPPVEGEKKERLGNEGKKEEKEEEEDEPERMDWGDYAYKNGLRIIDPQEAAARQAKQLELERMEKRQKEIKKELKEIVDPGFDSDFCLEDEFDRNLDQALYGVQLKMHDRETMIAFVYDFCSFLVMNVGFQRGGMLFQALKDFAKSILNYAEEVPADLGDYRTTYKQEEMGADTCHHRKKDVFSSSEERCTTTRSGILPPPIPGAGARIALRGPYLNRCFRKWSQEQPWYSPTTYGYKPEPFKVTGKYLFTHVAVLGTWRKRSVEERTLMIKWAQNRNQDGSLIVVRHLCGCSLCCNPHHLKLGTQKQNITDYFCHEWLKATDTREEYLYVKRTFIPKEKQEDGICQR